jgi:hypothetical protein
VEQIRLFLDDNIIVHCFAFSDKIEDKILIFNKCFDVLSISDVKDLFSSILVDRHVFDFNLSYYIDIITEFKSWLIKISNKI